MKLKNIKCLVVVVALWSSIIGHAQIDSLFTEVEKSSLDSSKIQELLDELQQILYTQPSEVLVYAERLDSVTLNLENDFLKGQILNYRGLAYYVNELFDESIPVLLKALNIFEKIKSKTQIARVSNSLATIYVLKNPEISEDYYKKAITIYQDLGDTLWTAIVSSNFGTMYLNEERFEEADTYLTSAKQLFSHLDRPLISAINSCNLGLAKVRQGLVMESLEYSHEALTGMPYESSPLLHCASNLALGEAYLALKNLPMAKEKLDLAYKISLDIGNQTHQQEISIKLSEYYETKNNFKEALKYYRTSSELRDSVLNEEEYAEMADAIKRYEGEKKEQQIAILSAENEIKDLKIETGRRNTFLALLGLLALSFISFLIYRSRKKTSILNHTLLEQKAVISKSLEEKEVLLKEIHHRVKNNLQIVSSLLGLQSRFVEDASAKEAIQTGRARVQSMSLLHQKLYNNNDLKSINVKDYFEDMAHNLFRNYKLTNKEITLTTDIDNLELDVDVMVPIGLISNELISNALKHAFTEGNMGEIVLKVKDNEDHILIEVSDNGKGIDSNKISEEGDSLGMQLIHSFAQKLEAQLSFSNENGTRVSLVIDKDQMAKVA